VAVVIPGRIANGSRDVLRGYGVGRESLDDEVSAAVAAAPTSAYWQVTTGRVCQAGPRWRRRVEESGELSVWLGGSAGALGRHRRGGLRIGYGESDRGCARASVSRVDPHQERRGDGGAGLDLPEALRLMRAGPA
jgi:hypothetical protein